MSATYQCFKDKVVLITGACSGIGKATAIKFTSYGARVALIDLNQKEPEIFVNQLRSLGGDAAFFPCDVSNEFEVQSMVDRVAEKFGQLDYVYNNAGIGGEFAKTQDYPTNDWRKVLAINLTGVFLCMKYEIPHLIKSKNSAMVNCASVLSVVASENDSAYVASKFGVIGLTKNAALEYASTGLRINSISPGFTRTPMIENGGEEKLKIISDKHPIGRLATPEEIAEGVLWLCSGSASYAVGMNLLIDGGYTLA